MLSFFRINDPVRLIGVFIILGLIRIPFLINTDLLMIPEIKWLLLGEKIANGNLLYKDVWDTTAPFSAAFYAFIHILVGKSVLTYRILSALITLFYAFLLTKILINNNLYLEKTYVPAVVFTILSSIFIDIFTLTPPLLGLGFILLTLDYLFKLLDKGLQDNQYYNIGFLIGLAALFYLPYAFLLSFVIVGMFFYSNTSLRKYLLTILGLFFPFLVLFIFYSLYYGLESLYYMYLISFLTVEKIVYVGIQNLLILVILPILFVVLAMGKLFVAPRFANFQQKAQQLMFFYMIAASFSYLFITEIATYHLILIIPAFTFFISHYFLLIKRKLFAEIAFVLFIVTIPLLNIAISNGFWGAKYFNADALLVKNSSETITDKKILVLGEDISAYQNNSLASPYLNWKLAKNHFKNLNFFEVVIAVNDNLRKDFPEVIIDESKSIDILFEKIPQLSQKYERCGGNTFCLKK